MPEQPDMNAPVTRGELYEALETWAGALIARMEQIFATKAELAAMAATMAATMATKQELAALAATMATKEDVARHANAIMEAGAAQIAMLDEKYKDLPPRVERLEQTVYKRTKRAKTTRSPGPPRR